MNLIKVYRYTKRPCIVDIVKDRNNDKYRFVNLTSKHICLCEFDSIDEAINDLESRKDVDYYEFINI